MHQTYDLTWYYSAIQKFIIYDPEVETDYIYFGLLGEVGEVTSLLAKSLRDNKPLDSKKLRKEIGDCFWFITMFKAINNTELELQIYDNSSYKVSGYDLLEAVSMLSENFISDVLAHNLLTILAHSEGAYVDKEYVENILKDNISKLKSRKQKNTLSGSGDNR